VKQSAFVMLGNDPFYGNGAFQEYRYDSLDFNDQ
jgi:hypothetical protein